MDQANRAMLQRRLKRWEDRNGLWLLQLLAVLQQICGERSGLSKWLASRIKKMADGIMAIVVCHAALQTKPQHARGFDDPRRSRKNCNLRAVIGASLRRAFKARTLLGGLAKIRRALEQRDVLIARLARRLRQGLTRICSAHTRAPIADGAETCPPFVIFAAAKGAPVAAQNTS